MKNILIIEPILTGHRGGWVKVIQDSILDKGGNVILATSTSQISHPQFADLKQRSSLLVTIDSEEVVVSNSPGIAALVKSELRYYSLFKQMYAQALKKKGVIDLVIVPYFDYIIYSVSIFGSPFGNTPWSGIVMRPAFHFSTVGIIAPKGRLDGLKRRLFSRLLGVRFLWRVFTIDETLLKYSSCLSVKNREKLAYLPDPMVTAEDLAISKFRARSLLALPIDGYMIVVVGSIDRRKDIATLLDSLLEYSDLNHVNVCLLGVQDPFSRKLLDGCRYQRLVEEGRLVSMDRFLTDTEMSQAFCAADCIWLGYRGHYQMSSILVASAYLKKPVISCSEGLIGWYTRKYRLGEILDSPSIDSVHKSILRLQSGLRQDVSVEDSFLGHTKSNFSNILCAMLDSEDGVVSGCSAKINE